MQEKVAAVVIGRNEGDRLIRCLSSLSHSIEHIVYVDSGSTDGSVESAEKLGVSVVTLDMMQPFTAARARNAGAEKICQLFPDTEYIQFVDGDCEVDLTWVDKAYTFLNKHAAYAVVCGRRRERFPEESIFNLLCDIEWDSPVGDALSCGGDALIRIDAFRSVSGFNDALIAGEEPEMCYRMRQNNWKIKRIDAEMTLHDAAMTQLGQWWKRAKRAGYAFANNFQLHGRDSEHFKRREMMSIIWWALVFPILVVILSLYDAVFSSLFLLYIVQIFKIVLSANYKGLTIRQALYYGVSTVCAKWPQLMGILSFWGNHIKGRKGRLIEYK